MTTTMMALTWRCALPIDAWEGIMTKQFTDMGRGVRELKLQELHAAYERQHGPLPISPFQGGKGVSAHVQG
ncbi:MAG: hypothetical protein R2867_00960 [Caldilineaceae bacterium]